MKFTEIIKTARSIEAHLETIQKGDKRNYDLALRFVKSRIEVNPKNPSLSQILEAAILSEINAIEKNADRSTLSYSLTQLSIN